MQESLEIIVKCVDLFEEYFNTSYPLEKLGNFCAIISLLS
jgi:hypothetical protein